MVPNQAKLWLGPKLDETLRVTELGHFSWVGPYCPALEQNASPEFRKAADSLVRRMGYQFRLTEIRHPAEIKAGGDLSIAITGMNEGVAPFYYAWPVELAPSTSEASSRLASHSARTSAGGNPVHSRSRATSQ